MALLTEEQRSALGSKLNDALEEILSPTTKANAEARQAHITGVVSAYNVLLNESRTAEMEKLQDDASVLAKEFSEGDG